MRYARFDFSSVLPEKILNIQESKDIINILLKNKKLNPQFGYVHFTKKHDLLNFWKSVIYYTQFLNEAASMIERLYCVYYDISRYPKCSYCEDTNVTFRCNFRDGYNKFCSHKCSRLANNPLILLSEEERSQVYSKVVATRKKLNNYIPDIETRKKMSDSGKKSIHKKRETNLLRYGVDNPGVLGAYYSKAASEYILNFLQENGISKDRCLYRDKTLNLQEFYQMVYVPSLGKNRYFSYDLVVFEDSEALMKRDLNKIELVLEYNGPWHYKKEEILGHEQEPSTPYKNHKVTKQESVKLDELKLTHISKYTKKIFIYWKKYEELQQLK